MTPRTPLLVSLTGTGAQVFTWVYFGATAVLALWSLSDSTRPVVVFVVLGLYAAVGIAMGLDKGEPLRLPVAIVVVVVAPASVILVAWQLVPGGYTAWYVGAATAMLFFLNLRGRIVLAWVGCALFVGTLLWWGATTSVGIADAAFTATRQAGIVAVGTLTALALQRTSGRIRELVAEASVRSAAEAAGLAVADERSRRLAELRNSVVPLLHRIASGESISADDRSTFAVAEADLRDSLRARGLRVPAIMAAARAARLRGVDVVLLDDSAGDLDQADVDEFVAMVADALTHAVDGRVTARLLPPGRPVLGTLVADGSTYRQEELLRS
ncbi:hypothetical protein BH11ACT5_BH11ACT5_26610 [soil metagenome]